jgi:uncharacterized protein RhaS with RHS repeats
VDSRNSFAGIQGKVLPVDPKQIFYYHCSPAELPEDVTNGEGEVVWRGRYPIVERETTT